VVGRPVSLRQHVVDDVDAPGGQEREGLLDHVVLARHGVGEDQIEGAEIAPPQHARGIVVNERDARILADVGAREREHRLVLLDGKQGRRGVETVEQPGRADAGAGADLERAACRLRRRQEAQELAGLGGTAHVEAALGDGRQQRRQLLRRSDVEAAHLEYIPQLGIHHFSSMISKTVSARCQSRTVCAS
jgi:hypothetical protein